MMKYIFKRILATYIFFTRLPFWRIADVEKEYYERVVPLWPMVGWLTGGAMALVASLLLVVFPPAVAIILALIVRVLMTGALHEDGFADFCDGFGGGTSKQRILEIMKDSHIGTYGVLGLILYSALMIAVMMGLHSEHTELRDFASILIIADTFSKWTASTVIYFLPYARKETEAKNKLVYAKVTMVEKLVSICLGVLPMFVLLPFTSTLSLVNILLAASASVVTSVLLFRFMNKNIGGYTGDCCGATFIICECVFLLILLL